MKTFRQWLNEAPKVGLIISPGKEFDTQIKDPRTGQKVDKKYKYKQQKDEGGKITHVLTTTQKDAAGKDVTTEETFADDTFRNTFAIPVR